MTFRWDDDVVFKNCAKDDDKNKVRFNVFCYIHYTVLVFAMATTTTTVFIFAHSGTFDFSYYKN